jgi:hypothetical protein
MLELICFFLPNFISRFIEGRPTITSPSSSYWVRPNTSNFMRFGSRSGAVTPYVDIL